jgi:hypothetical protein
MRILFLVATMACLQFACSHGNQLRAQLDDAVQRHASIDEEIMDWGPPTRKETLSDGQLEYTWKFSWIEKRVLHGGSGAVDPRQHSCTIVITTSPDNVIQSYKTDDCS